MDWSAGRMRAIYIEWLDPTAESDWTPIKDTTLEFKPIRSVGWCIKEDDKALLIALNWDDDEEKVCEFIKIPKDLIQKRKWIKI